MSGGRWKSADGIVASKGLPFAALFSVVSATRAHHNTLWFLEKGLDRMGPLGREWREGRRRVDGVLLPVPPRSR